MGDAAGETLRVSPFVHMDAARAYNPLSDTTLPGGTAA